MAETQASGSTAVATTENLGIQPTITLNEGSTNVAPSPINLRLGSTNIKEPDLYLKEPDIQLNMGTNQLATAFSGMTKTVQKTGNELIIAEALIVLAFLFFKKRAK
ncbi:MAG: hypothetical protein M0Z48_04470 [Nitrospiraceae bacterium]|nr:hypothetical protein [Nitrospiraceae bacterium]